MIRLCLTGLACVCAEVFVREAFTTDAWSPPLFILFMIWLGSRCALARSVFVALIVGLLADGFARAPVGLNPVLGVVVIYVSAGCTERIQLRGFLHSALLGFLGGLAGLLTLGIIARWMLGEAEVGPRISELLVPTGVLSSLIAPVLFSILDRGGRRDASLAQLNTL